jgi:hypothetical protein
VKKMTPQKKPFCDLKWSQICSKTRSDGGSFFRLSQYSRKHTRADDILEDVFTASLMYILLSSRVTEKCSPEFIDVCWGSARPGWQFCAVVEGVNGALENWRKAVSK